MLNQMCHVMVFGGGDCGRGIGCGGGALMNGISALTRETPQSGLPLCSEDTMIRELSMR